MADKNWAKLQDENLKNYDYGIGQFETDYAANVPFLITVEGLGLSLLLIYNNSRNDRSVVEKAKANKQASDDSDGRVNA